MSHRSVVPCSHFRLPPLEFEAIVSQGKTFVNEENTTDSDAKSLYFCAQLPKPLFGIQNRLAAAQNLGYNGHTGACSVTAVFHHADECKGVVFVRYEAGKHGIGGLSAAQLTGSGLGTDGESGGYLKKMMPGS